MPLIVRDRHGPIGKGNERPADPEASGGQAGL
jgi:hypothetical protein